MKRKLLFIFLICITCVAYGQSESFIDSLELDKDNNILVFKTNCTGCIVMNNPCEEYVQNGNPWDQYVIWKNSKGYHIKKYNNCGTSDILTIKRWKGKPFEIITSKPTEIDTLSLKYPLSFNRKDSTWFETGINHYKYYHFSFPTDSIRELEIKEYAFREPTEDDDILATMDLEFKKNQDRYNFNNSTIIKELLDCVMRTLNKKDDKLKITNANNGYK